MIANEATGTPRRSADSRDNPPWTSMSHGIVGFRSTSPRTCVLAPVPCPELDARRDVGLHLADALAQVEIERDRRRELNLALRVEPLAHGPDGVDRHDPARTRTRGGVPANLAVKRRLAVGSVPSARSVKPDISTSRPDGQRPERRREGLAADIAGDVGLAHADRLAARQFESAAGRSRGSAEAGHRCTGPATPT